MIHSYLLYLLKIMMINEGGNRHDDPDCILCATGVICGGKFTQVPGQEGVPHEGLQNGGSVLKCRLTT